MQRPEVVRPLVHAPLQSFLALGLGTLILVGSAAPTRRLRVYYAACALVLLLASEVGAPLPVRSTDSNGEWMGDYLTYIEDREHFENYFGYESIPFPHHLTTRVIRVIDDALGATDGTPALAFRWLSGLAGAVYVAELVGIATLMRWSPTAMRYLALCVAAPVTLLFFGYR